MHTILDIIQSPTQIFGGGNVEDNYWNWLQKYELYLVASEKNIKLDKIKCALFLHMTDWRKGNIGIYNALTFSDTEKGNYKSIMRKFQEYFQGRKI